MKYTKLTLLRRHGKPIFFHLEHTICKLLKTIVRIHKLSNVTFQAQLKAILTTNSCFYSVWHLHLVQHNAISHVYYKILIHLTTNIILMWMFRKEMGAFTTVQRWGTLRGKLSIRIRTRLYNALLNNKNQYLLNLYKNTFLKWWPLERLLNFL